MNQQVKVEVLLDGHMSDNMLAYLLMERMLVDANRAPKTEGNEFRYSTLSDVCTILWNALTDEEMETLNSRTGTVDEKSGVTIRQKESHVL